MIILEQARALLKALPLCDHCLGRQFALLGHGLSNDERGKAIKIILVAEVDRLARENKPEGKKTLLSLSRNALINIASATATARGIEVEAVQNQCRICGGIFNHLNQLAEIALVWLKDYEYQSFLVGIHVPSEVEELEDELRALYGLSWSESIRNEFSREIGKRIQKVTGIEVDLHNPDILVLINPFDEELSLEVGSIYIAGNYRKLVRNLPQSRWLCNQCQGLGCKECGGTGKLYQESVEELIGIPLMKSANGVNYRIHAAGREDIDVRMLGSGRPFVLEVIQPKRRRIDLKEALRSINESTSGKVEVTHLEESSKEDVRKLKSEGQASKTYRAVVEFDGEVEDSGLQMLKGVFVGRTLNQLTPTRVAHRRVLKVRKKYIYELETRRLQPNRAELIIRCQGGLYVKEFISGDGGRTNPSVTEILNISTRCVELDVMDIDIGVRQ